MLTPEKTTITASAPIGPLRQFLNFLVYSNVWVAVPVTCLAWTTYWMWEQPVDGAMLAFIYLATLFLYSFHRLSGLRKIPVHEWSERHAWSARNKGIQRGITALAGAAAAALFFQIFLLEQPMLFVYLLVPAAAISIGYALPVLPWRGQWYRLRDVPRIKILLIALVVTAITLYLPLSTQWWFTFDFYIGLPYWLAYTIQRVLFLLAITIPFDVRDLSADARAGLKTMPTVLGAQRALRLAKRLAIASAVFAILPYLLIPMHETLVPMVGLLGGSVCAWLVAHGTNAKRSEFYFAWVVEGTMVAQWLCYGLAMLVL